MIDPNYNPNDPTGRRRSRFWSLRTDARIKPQPWRWPLARLGDRDPLVLAERVNGDRLGADIGYESMHFDRELYVPVYAAQDGFVTIGAETAAGFFVSIEHGSRTFATSYARMSKMFVTPCHGQTNRKRQWVRGGDVIGYAAKTPIAVRFELWKWNKKDGYAPIDPVAQLEEWIAPLAHPTSIPNKQAA